MDLHQRKKFSAGTHIFREGDFGDCAYLIESGQIQITIRKDSDHVPVSLLGPGDIFGEMAIIDGMPRSASAVAVADCELSVVSRELFQRRISDSDPILRLLISLLLTRVRGSTSVIKGLSLSQRAESPTSIINFAEARDRLKLENDLIKGLQNKEFYLDYQPIFDLDMRKLVGFEALMRWANPERGIVRPDLFIDAAEQTSVIHPLGEWCLHQGFGDLINIQQGLGQYDLTMSINVSVRQLNDPNFPTILEKAERTFGIDPRLIKLEVTERIFQEGPLILDMIHRIRSRGYSVSLDDFGTGYSSLTSFFNLKVDQVKIDRSFVNALGKDPKSKAIIRAVIAMATELGIGVVAEGIEKPSEIEQLTSLGCHFGQGYLFSKPVSVESLLRRFRQPKAS
jgi:EAL domain-containing protein (putative c-di-GMP-specific phosphodiesterase class I)